MANNNNNIDDKVDHLDEILEKIGVSPASFSSNETNTKLKEETNQEEEIGYLEHPEKVETKVSKQHFNNSRRSGKKSKRQKLSHTEYLQYYRKGKKNILIDENIYKEIAYHYSNNSTSKTINKILAEYLVKMHPSCKRKMEKILRNL